MTAAVAAAPALSVLERYARVYRRTWRGGIVTTLLSPVLFLLSMGVGLGSFVDHGGQSSALDGVSYLAFLAPGLLAAQAMQTASNETSFPVMAGIVWDRTYEAMLATPIRVADLLLGHLGWVTVRLTMVTTVFCAVMVAFGAPRSPLVVLAVPCAVLLGLAFAGPIMAFSATQRNDAGFNVLFRFVVTPLFLFGGTFFPVDRLPAILQPVAYVTPLYHGAELIRGLSLGTLRPFDAAAHLAVLATFAVVGAALAYVSLSRRLVK